VNKYSLIILRVCGYMQLLNFSIIMICIGSCKFHSCLRLNAVALRFLVGLSAKVKKYCKKILLFPNYLHWQILKLRYEIFFEF